MNLLKIFFCFYKFFTLLIFLLNTFVFSNFANDLNPQKWNEQAKNTIDSILNSKLNQNIAKNMIIFLGDGMGVSTVTSGRIRKGQIKGRHFSLKSSYQMNKILIFCKYCCL